MPYDRVASPHPRRFIITGSTNESEYLADTTGNRRFLPVQLGRIKLAALAEARDALISEARDLWLSNPDPALLQVPPDMYTSAASEQEARRVKDPIEDACEDYLSKVGNDPITTATLLYEVMHKTSAQSSSYDGRRIAMGMRRLGWEKCKMVAQDSGRKVNGWKPS